jgi:hypothetical protein
MGKWDRLTPWRQGAILTAGATTALGLISDRTPEHTAVVVVSHDCDLAQAPDHEPTVEAIVGRFIEKPDGNYMHCKNVRCLHLSITAGSRRCTIELEPRNRVPLLKSSDQATSLADFAPSPEFAMTQPDGPRGSWRQVALPPSISSGRGAIADRWCSVQYLGICPS